MQSSLLALALWLPIALGVPHIANDLRYLVRPLPQWQRVAALAGCAVLVVLRAVAVATGVVLVRAEAVVVAAWLVAMVALAPTTRPRFALVLAGATAIVALPVQFALGAALAHNVVAVIAWIVVARPGRTRALATVSAIAAFTALLVAAGPRLQPLANALHVPPAFAIAFLALQALHYLIWLVWIPDRAPARMAVLAGIAVVAAGSVNAAWTRATYLSLATFHIYLELVVLTARAARRSR